MHRQRLAGCEKKRRHPGVFVDLLHHAVGVFVIDDVRAEGEVLARSGVSLAEDKPGGASDRIARGRSAEGLHDRADLGRHGGRTRIAERRIDSQKPVPDPIQVIEGVGLAVARRRIFGCPVPIVGARRRDRCGMGGVGIRCLRIVDDEKGPAELAFDVGRRRGKTVEQIVSVTVGHDRGGRTTLGRGDRQVPHGPRFQTVAGVLGKHLAGDRSPKIHGSGDVDRVDDQAGMGINEIAELNRLRPARRTGAWRTRFESPRRLRRQRNDRQRDLPSQAVKKSSIHTVWKNHKPAADRRDRCGHAEIRQHRGHRFVAAYPSGCGHLNSREIVRPHGGELPVSNGDPDRTTRYRDAAVFLTKGQIPGAGAPPRQSGRGKVGLQQAQICRIGLQKRPVLRQQFSGDGFDRVAGERIRDGQGMTSDTVGGARGGVPFHPPSVAMACVELLPSL